MEEDYVPECGNLYGVGLFAECSYGKEPDSAMLNLAEPAQALGGASAVFVFESDRDKGHLRSLHNPLSQSIPGIFLFYRSS
jgi:hypothetical protein